MPFAGYHPSRQAHTHPLFFADSPLGIVLLPGAYGIALRLLHSYRAAEEAGRWTVHTASYSYEFMLRDGLEIIAYHYHPAGPSPVKTPHLHVRSATAPVPLSKAHIPTGRISLEAVLRFAIVELKVEPLRADWAAVLDRGEAEFNDTRGS
ncbi:MAG TPA: hypothetical protein VFW96_08100 [Thermomicrobiales bacterium]|nr:hypothetical protein [Thermomicrobiales bacterium]